MNPAIYYRSLTAELTALKDRVRNLIAFNHGPTDGEWKESVFRSILKRHMPNTIGVGRGFIIGENNVSSQIDVLLYDTACPLLYQEGDLVFVTPDSVRGIIEVKTKLSSSNLSDALTKLGKNAQLAISGGTTPFVGLFSYDLDLGQNPNEKLLRALQKSANDDQSNVVNHVCAGSNLFVRYWPINSLTGIETPSWYSYDVDNIAPGYFLANIVATCLGDAVRKNYWAWFPSEGKEIHKTGEMPLCNR